MRILTLAFALLFFSKTAFAQKDYSWLAINSGIGIGPNYGMIGSKTVIGHKNIGLLIGLGLLGGQPTYEIGTELSAGMFYANIGYGVYSHRDFTTYTDYATGLIMTFGFKRDLIKQQPFFVNFGLGFSFGDSYILEGIKQDWTMINIAAGIGYRFKRQKMETQEKLVLL